MGNLKGLMTALSAKIDSLLAGQEFEADDKSGLWLQPRVYHWELPLKRQADSPVMYGGDYPHIVLRPLEGGLFGIIDSPILLIRGGVYSSGDYASGAWELIRLLELLEPLQQFVDFPNWTQNDEYGLQWVIGNKEKGGAQPHPCHIFYATMRFQRDLLLK